MLEMGFSEGKNSTVFLNFQFLGKANSNQKRENDSNPHLKKGNRVLHIKQYLGANK